MLFKFILKFWFTLVKHELVTLVDISDTSCILDSKSRGADSLTFDRKLFPNGYNGKYYEWSRQSQKNVRQRW